MPLDESELIEYGGRMPNTERGPPPSPLPLHEPIDLDLMQAAGHDVHAVGKTGGPVPSPSPAAPATPPVFFN